MIWIKKVKEKYGWMGKVLTEINGKGNWENFRKRFNFSRI
jgi:hypothetical protein